MIRSILVGLSLLFFLLAALVIYRALQLSGSPSPYANIQPEFVPAPVFTPPPSAPEPEIAIDTLQSQDTQSAATAPVNETPIAIAPSVDQVPAAEEPVQPVNTDKSRTMMVFGGKTFRSGQDVIHNVPYATIENLVKDISASPGNLILIEGHTDNIPTGKVGTDNQDLSLRRAKAIANILMLHGIPPQRISVKGYGDTRPVESNDTEEGRAKNRRVEVKLLATEGDN